MNIKRFWPFLVFISGIILLSGCGEEGVISADGTSSTSTELFVGADSGVNFVEGELQIDSTTISTSGSTEISAYIVDSNNMLSTASHTITFTSNCVTRGLAAFSAASVTTTNGIASTTYSDQGCANSDTITATVTINGTQHVASGSITIDPASTTITSSTLRLGSGSGSGFSEGDLQIDSTTISTSGSTEIRAYIVDSNNLPSNASHTVSFVSNCSTLGQATFSAASVTTTNGIASTTYSDQSCANGDTITATVTLNNVLHTASGSVTITSTTTASSLRFGSGTGSGFTESVLEIKNSTVAANGSTVISAYIVDGNGLPDAGPHTVSFSSGCAVQSLASFSSASVITTSGIATTTYNDLGCVNSDTLTATVTLNSVQKVASGSVTLDSSVTSSSTRIGKGTLASFVNGKVALTQSLIAASGSTGVSVNLVDDSGNLVTTTNTVNFSSTCEQNLDANFTASTVITSSGTASTTYTASGCTNSDIIVASATVDGVLLSANETVTISPAAAGSVQFTSVSNSRIALKGTGSTGGLPESSQVTFTVLDNLGSPLSGEDVTFSLDSTVGGVTLANLTSTSNNNGVVVATVTSGTVATSVRVTAVVDSNTSLVTTSSAIAIATGPPDQDSMSLSAETLNPRAWNLDGATVEITARVADRFNNRIQDGTAISFFTELGSIDASCTTVNGACSVDWVSQNPRTNPNVAGNAGRSTILAIVEGEESFLDVNSNGVFDDGDSFTDLGEAIRDDDEDGAYDVGEFFTDLDNDNTYDASASPGLYNGAGCAHSTLCDPNSESVSVRDSLVLVMAEDNPAVLAVAFNGVTQCNSQANCAVTASYPTQVDVNGAGAVRSVTFTIAGKANEQVLPVGTQVNFTAGGKGKITAGASHTVANTNINISTDPAVAQFTVYLSVPDAVSGDSILQIEVTIGEKGGTFAFPPIEII